VPPSLIPFIKMLIEVNLLYMPCSINSFFLMSPFTTAMILKVSSVEVVKTLSSFIVGHYEKTQSDPNTFERNLSPPITTKSTIELSSQARPLKPLMIKPFRLFILYIKGEYVSLNVVFIMINFVL